MIHVKPAGLGACPVVFWQCKNTSSYECTRYESTAFAIKSTQFMEAFELRCILLLYPSGSRAGGKVVKPLVVSDPKFKRPETRPLTTDRPVHSMFVDRQNSSFC